MAQDLYCSRGDVTARLPPGTVVSPAGILASCLASTDVLTYDGHGLETDDEVTVRAASAGTLSAPLAAGTTYYAIRLSNAAFKLAATAGGAALNITSDGVEMIVAREPKFDDTIEFVSRWAETFLHRRYKRSHAPLKYGSGRTEWFKRGAWIVEAIAIAGLISAGQWCVVWGSVYLILLIFVR